METGPCRMEPFEWGAAFEPGSDRSAGGRRRAGVARAVVVERGALAEPVLHGRFPGGVPGRGGCARGVAPAWGRACARASQRGVEPGPARADRPHAVARRRAGVPVGDLYRGSGGPQPRQGRDPRRGMARPRVGGPVPADPRADARPVLPRPVRLHRLRTYRHHLRPEPVRLAAERDRQRSGRGLGGHTSGRPTRAPTDRCGSTSNRPSHWRSTDSRSSTRPSSTAWWPAVCSY